MALIWLTRDDAFNCKFSISIYKRCVYFFFFPFFFFFGVFRIYLIRCFYSVDRTNNLILRGTTATSTLASPPSVLLFQLMWHCWRRNLKGLLGTRGMLRGDMLSQEREPLLTGQKFLKITSSSARMLPAQPWMNLLQNAPDQHWKDTGQRKRRGDLLLPRRQS